MVDFVRSIGGIHQLAALTIPVQPRAAGRNIPRQASNHIPGPRLRSDEVGEEMMASFLWSCTPFVMDNPDVLGAQGWSPERLSRRVGRQTCTPRFSAQWGSDEVNTGLPKTMRGVLRDYSEYEGREAGYVLLVRRSSAI